MDVDVFSFSQNNIQSNANSANNYNPVYGGANNNVPSPTVKSFNGSYGQGASAFLGQAAGESFTAPAMGRVVESTVNAISSDGMGAPQGVSAAGTVSALNKSNQSASLVDYRLTDADITSGYQYTYDSLKQFNPDLPSKINDSVNPAIFNTPYELKPGFDPKSASFLANNIIGMVGTIASIMAAPIGGAPGGIANAAATAGRLGLLLPE